MTAAPRTFRIAAIPADGVGKEVVAAGRAVLDALAETSNASATPSPSPGRSSPGAATSTSAPAR